MINTGAIRAKTCLSFTEPLVDMFLVPIKQCPSKDFARYNKSVIPHQLSQFPVSPFFGIFISRPHLQSFGILPSFHIFSIRGCNMFAVISKSTFSTSGEILSNPAVFPLLNSFNAF